MGTFEQELTDLINRYSKENDSDTPDFILAEYLEICLNTWALITKKRDEWYGQKCGNGQRILNGAVDFARKEAEKL